MTETLVRKGHAGLRAAGERAGASIAHPSSQNSVWLWLILGFYACARCLEIVPTPVPRMAIVAMDVLSAMSFALVLGARQYGLRGILWFTGICIVAGNAIENLGVMTGFPFGRYYFVDLMGPKLFHIPVLLGLAYIGMAYVSWTLATMIVAAPGRVQGPAGVFGVPVVASFIMVAWDLAQDPVWSTVLHGWVWQDGGPWFGVPISNYFGWYLTVFVIYLCFSVYLNRSGRSRVASRRASGRMAIVFYAVCAAANVTQAIPSPNPAVVADPTGRLWRVTDITGASSLVSIFVMGAFSAIACATTLTRQRATD